MTRGTAIPPFYQQQIITKLPLGGRVAGLQTANRVAQDAEHVQRRGRRTPLREVPNLVSGQINIDCPSMCLLDSPLQKSRAGPAVLVPYQQACGGTSITGAALNTRTRIGAVLWHMCRQARPVYSSVAHSTASFGQTGTCSAWGRRWSISGYLVASQPGSCTPA